MINNSLVNEGELSDDDFQLNLLSFGIATPRGFSGPFADYKGCLRLHRGLEVLPVRRLVVLFFLYFMFMNVIYLH